MLKKFTLSDKLLFVAAFLSLIFSEVLYFQGNKDQAIFIGIWVPSILAFGIYLKLIQNNKDVLLNPILRGTYNIVIWPWICICTSVP